MALLVTLGDDPRQLGRLVRPSPPSDGRRSMAGFLLISRVSAFALNMLTPLLSRLGKKRISAMESEVAFGSKSVALRVGDSGLRFRRGVETSGARVIVHSQHYFSLSGFSIGLL